MSIWTNIEGSVRILKKDKISIKDVFKDVLTDEIFIEVETKDFPDSYEHRISCRARIDGEAFVDRYKDLIHELHPVRGGLDLTCSVRFLV